MDASPLEPTPPTSESESPGEITMATTTLILYCAQFMCYALITLSQCTQCSTACVHSDNTPLPPLFLPLSSSGPSVTPQSKGKGLVINATSCSLHTHYIMPLTHLIMAYTDYTRNTHTSWVHVCILFMCVQKACVGGLVHVIHMYDVCTSVCYVYRPLLTLGPSQNGTETDDFCGNNDILSQNVYGELAICMSLVRD